MKNNITLFYFFFTFIIFFTPSIHSKTPLIMLDPIGHADFTGRKLLNGYERGIMLTFAQNLQTALQNDYQLETVISRKAGESIAPLEIASFANRLQVGLFINLQAFLTPNAKPIINIYHLCFNKFTEFNQSIFEPGTFIPVEKAHIINIKKTATIAASLKTLLIQSENIKFFDTSNPLALPIKSLTGITAPAISLEIGIANEKLLTELINPLAKTISDCYKKHIISQNSLLQKTLEMQN